jgi:hypothetical protein
MRIDGNTDEITIQTEFGAISILHNISKAFVESSYSDRPPFGKKRHYPSRSADP